MMGKDFIQAVLKAGKVLGMAGEAATGILSSFLWSFFSRGECSSRVEEAMEAMQ